MSGGEWNTTRERKQLAADARELEREQVRLAKRMLRDLRWSAERSTLRKSDWADLLKLHHAYGKEGPHAAMAGTGALLVTESDNERRDSMPQVITSRTGSLKLTAKNPRRIR
jgi:hypothetical protein